MTNPFTKRSLPRNEQDQQRRERFKFAVYAGLSGLALLLVGALIQGCHAQQKVEAADAAASQASTSTNAPDLTTNAVASLSPLTNATVETTNAAGLTTATPVTEPTNTPVVAASTNAPETIQSTPGAADHYVIKKGDTLIGIAKAHHTTVKALKTTNGLTSDRIVAGKELKLPPPTTAPLATR